MVIHMIYAPENFAVKLGRRVILFLNTLELDVVQLYPAYAFGAIYLILCRII